MQDDALSPLPDSDDDPNSGANGARYTEIYCTSCKKSLGRYNEKFYNDYKIAEMLKTSHAEHVREGHTISIRESKE